MPTVDASPMQERLAWVGPGKTVALASPDDDVTIEASNALSWIGGDGGPGDRDGLCALLDEESVGSVVLPAVRSDALTPVLRFAVDHPELFLFFRGVEKETGRSPSISRPLANVAVLRVPEECDETLEDLVDLIESRDFEPVVAPGPGARTRARRSERTDGAWTVVESEILSILAWRRWRGLERSLERGTRWVVFQPSIPSLVRSIDRDVRSFLRKLAYDGLVPRCGGFEVSVACVPDIDPDTGASTGVPEEGRDGRLVLQVRARLAGEYGDALKRHGGSDPIVAKL